MTPTVTTVSLPRRRESIGELVRVPTVGPTRELRLGALTPKSPPRLATLTLLHLRDLSGGRADVERSGTT